MQKFIFGLFIMLISFSALSDELADYEKMLLTMEIKDPNNNLIDNTPLTKEEILFFKKECYCQEDFEYNLFNCIRIQEKLKNIMDQFNI